MTDWRALRRALGLTQVEFSELLGASERTVHALEKSPRHRCLRRAGVLLLRTWLQEADYRSRLQAAGLADPWPEDFEDA